MTEIQWVLAANVAVWLGLGAYIFYIARTQCALEKRLQQKESMDNV